MDTAYFQNIRRIFERALEQDSSAREQFIEDSCNGDKDLQREVSRLLSAHDSADSWFDREVVESIIRPTSVAFKPGTKIGTYEILELLGVGGMGEVYRARDTTLHSRQVAIKVLPETFSRDPERVSRFEREALVLASLNHAHIGAIYHVVESNASRFLVLELVEGETLAARIADGPIPLTEALAYAKQITEALEYAHERGIVHRDLKPANIKVTPDDQIKVLDFGLAKVRDNPWINPKDSPTLSETAPARILGTAAYMSPEQASGKEADGRSDIWALGCLLHEMLTGHALFTGESVSEILAEVLKGEPDFSRLPASTPQSIRRLLRRCLQKDRKRRIRHIADARMEIDEAFSEPESGLLIIGSSRITRREALAWISVGGLAIANAATAIWMNQTRNDEISIDPHYGTGFTGPDTATVPVPQFAISPDGETIVFAAAKSKDQPELWVRGVYEAEATRLPGTDGAEGPFWSPDGEWIGFFAQKKLKKVPAKGGHVAVITGDGVSDPRGGSWGTDDTILFASGISQIYSVSANTSGGSKTEITTLNREEKEGSHRWPHFLPDGKHFLYTVRSGSLSRRGIWVANVKDRTINRQVANVDSNALYSRSGHILFLDRNQLLAQPFDLKKLSVSGQPAVIATGVGRSTLGNGAVSVSNYGSLAYAGPMRQTGKLQEFDKKGAPKGEPLDDEQNEYEYTDFRFSHDERWLAVTRSDHEKGWVDIWLKDLERNSWDNLLEPGNTINASPVWLHNSSHVVFRSNPSGVIELYRKQVPRGPLEVLLSEDDMHRDPRQLEFTSLALTDCAPDDSRILCSVPTADGYDLWQMPITKKARAESFLESPGNQIHGNFSPDGKFIAFASRKELGRYEVYVVDSSRPQNSVQWVSTGVKQAEGGSEPRWRSDGKELYYMSEDRSLVAVPFESGMPGTPSVLFRTGAPTSINALRMNYVPKRDGQSFLVNTLAHDQTEPFIKVLTNWTSRL